MNKCLCGSITFHVPVPVSLLSRENGKMLKLRHQQISFRSDVGVSVLGCRCDLRLIYTSQVDRSRSEKLKRCRTKRVMIFRTLVSQYKRAINCAIDDVMD